MIRNQIACFIPFISIGQNDIIFNNRTYPSVNGTKLKVLTDIIYVNCYSRRFDEDNHVVEWGTRDHPYFYESLRKANKSKKGWADHFFYYVLSDTVFSDENLVRIYWNVIPEGAPQIVEKISLYLNKYRIPFQFKCLKSPDSYTRNDSGVLYVDKIFANVTFDVISLFYPSIRSLLKTAIPLFTKRIANGIAFAEDPGNGQSFGMNMSRLLSSSLLQVLDGEKTQLVDRVIRQMESIGISNDRPYLNPNSCYPYCFPLLDRK